VSWKVSENQAMLNDVVGW